METFFASYGFFGFILFPICWGITHFLAAPGSEIVGVLPPAVAGFLLALVTVLVVVRRRR